MGVGKGSHSLEVVSELQVLVKQVAEVGDREGVHPVVVRGISVALLHHQTEPGAGERAADRLQALLLQVALWWPCPIPFLSSRSQCLGINCLSFMDPAHTHKTKSSLLSQRDPSPEGWGQWK